MHKTNIKFAAHHKATYATAIEIGSRAQHLLMHNTIAIIYISFIDIIAILHQETVEYSQIS